MGISTTAISSFMVLIMVILFSVLGIAYFKYGLDNCHLSARTSYLILSVILFILLIVMSFMILDTFF